jgi:hypothetical protein
MIHVVFQQADVGILEKVLELDQSLSGKIMEIKDDFAVGPLQDLDTEEGWQARGEWWKNLLQQSPYAPEIVAKRFDDRITVATIKESLIENEQEQLWIWMGQNAHDVCGYYWLVSQLKDFAGRVMILYMNNLPFLNEKGQLFYPTTLHQIQPKEFLKAKKLCRKITLSEFEIDPDEWKKLVTENAPIRILEGGKKIAGKDAHFYDEDIINGLTADWQKGNRAMHTILSKMKLKTGDVFLLGRMKKLAEEERIEITGDPSNGWKEFEVKLKAAAIPAAVP